LGWFHWWNFSYFSKRNSNNYWNNLVRLVLDI
jgi:hypothetical protein